MGFRGVEFDTSTAFDATSSSGEPIRGVLLHANDRIPGAAMGLGYDYGNGLRTEIEFHKISREFTDFDNEGTTHMYGFLGNVVYEHDLKIGANPYIGLGGGWSKVASLLTLVDVGDYEKAQWTPMIQAMTGVSIEISDNVNLNVGARFMHIRGAEGERPDGFLLKLHPTNLSRVEFGLQWRRKKDVL